MKHNIRVKICGLSTRDTIAVAVEEGAAYIGFVFFEKSPRNVSIEHARDLALSVPEGVAKVALTVDASDAFLDELTSVVPLDMLQLHGNENPERVSEVRERYRLPLMKAVGVKDEGDLQLLDAYAKVADQILVDTKAPKGSDRPGGNGETFDWGLVANRRWSVPWMLAGGLTADNAMDAVRQTGARQLDLSSAVESAPGVKDPEKIRAFMRAVR